MKKPVSATQSKASRKPRRASRLRSLHRWFGLAALVFVLLLSLTGIALNHAAELRLDQRIIEARWLLDWYGLNTPDPAAVYGVGADRVSLFGNRLYLNGQEAARGISELAGALAWDGLIVAATGESLIYLSPAAEQVERIELGAELPGPIVRFGKAGHVFVVTSAGRDLAFDERDLSIEPLDAGVAPDWSDTAPLAPELADAIARQYRGPGISLERLLYDLHSGRLFARAGAFAMDLVGLLLVALSVSGLWIWLRLRR